MEAAGPVFGDLTALVAPWGGAGAAGTDFSAAVEEIRRAMSMLEEAKEVLFEKTSALTPMSALDLNTSSCAAGLANKITEIKQKANNLPLLSKNEQQLVYKKNVIQSVNLRLAKTTSEIQNCLTKVSMRAEEDNKRASRFVSSEATTFDPNVYTQEYTNKTEATWDIRGVERMGRTISNMTSMLGVFNAALETQKAQLLNVENTIDTVEDQIETGNTYLSKALSHYKKHRKVILLIQIVIFICMLILLFKK